MAGTEIVPARASTTLERMSPTSPPVVPASPKIVRKRREDARVKNTADSDRQDWWARRGAELMIEVRRLKPEVALEKLVKELAVNSILHSRRREELEVRVARLEAGAKPRIRVPAGRRAL